MKINYIEAPTGFNHLPDFEGIPAELGFSFPAEWAPHDATWLSWPHNPNTWPGKIEKIYPAYCQFIKLVSEGEKVKINVADRKMAEDAARMIAGLGTDMKQIFFYENPTNDAWCRDHGPAFLLNKDNGDKMIVDWGYNAWGGKYPPYDLDDVIPTRIAEQEGLKVAHPGIVMEGGSVEFNGNGTLMTTTSCLLNPNRNPDLSKEEIEDHLRKYYGVEHILWLGDGIVGDDTDGHIDDITRFVNESTVLTVIEDKVDDENYLPLQENLRSLKKCTIDGAPLTIIELPMPGAVYYQGQRLPASYANFYISNKYVIVPVFDDPNDDRALDIIQGCFPDREVVGINSVDIIWGLGSFHCLSQQEPSIQ
ncbi:MAG TPA: agmatine deiminase [Balneolaceae bacterium]|nr:agmatine deiminase [Balneolaceae bacterium]|tara:strand:- start:99786 stop:100877 length:1092 start_codon:yes stop_codon:yes gene_type:complete